MTTVTAHASTLSQSKPRVACRSRYFQIAESFRRFGLQDGSKDIVAVKVGGDRAAVEAHLLENVKGTPQTLIDNHLASTQDVARIRKIYRLDAPKKGEAATLLSTEAEAFVLGSMALKGS